MDSADGQVVDSAEMLLRDWTWQVVIAGGQGRWTVQGDSAVLMRN
jgi:hypothetical protein